MRSIVALEVDKRAEGVQPTSPLVDIVAVLYQSQYPIKKFRIALYKQMGR